MNASRSVVRSVKSFARADSRTEPNRTEPPPPPRKDLETTRSSLPRDHLVLPRASSRRASPPRDLYASLAHLCLERIRPRSSRRRVHRRFGCLRRHLQQSPISSFHVRVVVRVGFSTNEMKSMKEGSIIPQASASVPSVSVRRARDKSYALRVSATTHTGEPTRRRRRLIVRSSVASSYTDRQGHAGLGTFALSVGLSQ